MRWKPTSWREWRRPNRMGAHPGERAPRARLTARQVWFIRVLWATGRVSLQTLGWLFGVRKQTIFRIVHSETWREQEDIG